MSGSDQRPVLVTGAAGFIGSHVSAALLRSGRAVVGIDNFDPFYDASMKRRNLDQVRAAELSKARFEFIEADLCEPPAISTLLAKHRPAGVIHLAAKAGVRPSIADPAGYVRANVLATSILLESLRAHNAACGERGEAGACDRVVIASSSSVYGNSCRAPFAETADVGEPISPYAATKRACELIGYTHWHLTKMPVAMLRFFTVYGPRQRPDLAISLFLCKVSRAEEITVFGDGSMARDFTYIDDIVSGVLAAYERIPRFGYRIWNLGNSSPVALSDLIATVERTVGTPALIRRAPQQPGDVDITFADLTRATAELGYRPSTTLAAGVRAQFEAMR